MLTDVALGERAEHRVDQRMQGNVGIRVAGDPARMRNAHAAEHDVIALDKGVHVEAVPGAHVGERRHAQGFGADEIVAGGQLHVAGLALEHGDALSGPFGERSIVGEILAARGRGAAVGVEQHRKGEGLRGLHHAQVGAVDGRDDPAGAVDLLHGVGDGDGRDGGAGRARRIDGARHQRIRQERPRGVVDQDDIRRAWRQGLHSRPHRALPRGAAMHRREEVEPGGRCLEHRCVIRMDDRLHGIDGAMRSKARQARPDHRFAGDRTILLGHIAARPQPAPSRNHDRYHPRCHESVQYCAARARL